MVYGDRSAGVPGAPGRHRSRWLRGTVAVALAASTLAVAQPAQAQAPVAPAPEAQAPATGPAPALKPYMGWSSWSLQATTRPGVNPDGPASWLNEKNVIAQADVMASSLKQFGYNHINVDAGWLGGADQYGRPAPDLKKFPRGKKWLGDYLHGKGLKYGTYLAVGLEPKAYGDGSTPIHGAPGCTTKDIVYPDLRKTNGWDTNYKMDFTKPCSQAYINSIADLLASWGVDFLKLDGVGPGSFKGGDNYDNTTDVAAWNKALKRTGRPIEFLVSWGLSHHQADVWKQNTNGWRIDTDVECYCDTLVTWNNSVKQRWNDVVQWIDDARPGHWNNLDSINVGNGEMDGITEAERQSYMTLWAISAAPLYIGDDLTKLDSYGLSLLTNRDVIALNQAGIPAKPVDQRTEQQTWYARNADGSLTVALFNLGGRPAKVTADWSDLGITGAAGVKDLWSGADLGPISGSFGADLPTHGSRLLRVTPQLDARTPAVPLNVRATKSTSDSVALAWDDSQVRNGRVVGYEVFDGTRKVAFTRTNSVTVGGLAPAGAHRFTVVALTANGKRSGASKAVPVTTKRAGGPVSYEAEAAGNVLAGGSSISDCPGCSGGRKVGNVGGSGGLTFPAITVPADGTYLLTLSYVDASSARIAVLTVNGRSFQVPTAGSNDNNWSGAQDMVVPVELTAGTNSLSFGNPADSVADIDKVAL